MLVLDKDDVMTQQIINNQQKVDDEALAESVRNSLPSHWQEVSVGDICNIKTSFPSFNLLEKLDTKSNADELVLALKVSDMNSPANQRYLTEAKQVFRYSREEIKKGRFLRPGSIVFPKRGGAIGTNKKRITKHYSLLDPNLIGIEPSNAVDGEYLLGFFDRFDLRSLQDNNPIPQLNKNDVESIILPLPPLSEQRTIVKVLLTVQEAIQTRRDELDLERERKAALMQYIFTHGTRGETTKQTEIGEMPESWKVVKLGDKCNISTGTTPSTERPEYYQGTIPFIKTSEIVNNRIKKAQTHISEQAREDYNLKIYPPGTIFMAMYGQGKTRGQVALLDISATTTQNTAAIVPNEELEPEFLWQWFMGQYNNLREAGSIGHISHLNLGYVKQYKVLIPPLSEQREIAAILQVSNDKVDALEQELVLHEELFRALLEELMTGRLSTLPLIEKGGTDE